MISGHHFGRSRGGRQSGGAAERARRPEGVLEELGELDGPGGEEDCDCEVASEVGAVFEEEWFDVRGRGSGAGAGPRGSAASQLACFIVATTPVEITVVLPAPAPAIVRPPRSDCSSSLFD